MAATVGWCTTAKVQSSSNQEGSRSCGQHIADESISDEQGEKQTRAKRAVGRSGIPPGRPQSGSGGATVVVVADRGSNTIVRLA